MKLEINIEKQHLFVLVLVLIVIAGINYVIAIDTSIGWHPWSQIDGIPAGFADGVDDEGITSESDPNVLASVKDGITWTEISSRPAGLDDGDQVGITSVTLECNDVESGPSDTCDDCYVTVSCNPWYPDHAGWRMTGCSCRGKWRNCDGANIGPDNTCYAWNGVKDKYVYAMGRCCRV